MMRIAVKFARTGMTRFLSHLDMQRTFSRTLRRTDFQVKTSSGFNPHIVMSFASALSVGMETRGDYLEFTLLDNRDIGEVCSTLNDCLPPDIRILDGYLLGESVKKIMSVVYAAEIEYIAVPDEREEFVCAVVQFLKNKEWFIEKKGKRDVKKIDIMRLIYSVEIGDTVKFKLAHSNEASLNPFVLLNEIFSCAGKEYSIRVIRNELCNKDLGPLYDLF